jgi:hypothetical protein
MAGGWKSLDKSQLPPKYRELIRDCYDNCLSYLDGQLGELFDMLERRGVLDQTLVIVTADHGEELGEHGLFEHGESLYRPEIHVPLLIIAWTRPVSGGCARDRQPARPAGNDRGSHRHGGRSALPRFVAVPVVARCSASRRQSRS